MIGREDEVREYRGRVKAFYYIVFFALCLIGSRLFYLQIMKGEDLRKYSDGNRLKKERLFASRGIIYDRNGKIIVDNRASFDVVLLSQYYTASPQANSKLAKALDIDLEDLEKRISKISRMPSFYPILLKADVSKDVIAAVEMGAIDGDFKGVDIEANVQRRYPMKEISAQLLGYIGEVDTKDIAADPRKQLQPGDYIGKMGIERYYDNYLRGSNGVGYVEVDATGRRKKSEGAEKLLGFVTQDEPVTGKDIYLTLDVNLEKAAADAMKSRNYNGSVVALDPRTGEILAMVNYPSYDPQYISGREVNAKVWNQLRDDPDRPLRNRAIQDHYPPGSTFKLFLAMGVLGEKKATAHTSVNCTGQLRFGKRTFACWKRHGTVDLIHAIKESCDVFFYEQGLSLGIDEIAKYARMFGLGSRTGLNLAGEQKGLIPDSKWKEQRYHEAWQPGETLSVAIGQGAVDVTPIQLVDAYAAIGNEGFLWRPFIVKKIEGKNGSTMEETKPQLTRKIELPPEVFQTVKEGLFKVVNEPGGTATSGHSTKTIISGKTGTAQVKTFTDMKHVNCAQLDLKDRHHAWFVGYAPRDNPQIAVAAIAEHACHGTAASHVVKDVIDAFMDEQNALAQAQTQAKAQEKTQQGSVEPASTTTSTSLVAPLAIPAVGHVVSPSKASKKPEPLVIKPSEPPKVEGTNDDE